MSQNELFQLLPPELHEELRLNLFAAYFDCRRNKRNSYNALDFEVHFERSLYQLFDELIDGIYKPRRSITFIVRKPVLREIFAADFRDRVIHHLLINKLNPWFENLFIADSYACRVGKGTHFGINRIDQFIREVSQGYTTDAWVLKLDIQSFFMSIDRTLLRLKLHEFLNPVLPQKEVFFWLNLIDKVVGNDPVKGCLVKGRLSDWDDLPKHKSLLKSGSGKGLPIGNLTSQVFANFFLHEFDCYVTDILGSSHYGRYVDDFVLIHEDKDHLLSLIPKIRSFLGQHVQLDLHPRKQHLQHYTKGLPFLGTFIKPGRIYVSRRIKGNFYEKIEFWNNVIDRKVPSIDEVKVFVSVFNSYLGMLHHYKTGRLRRSLLDKLDNRWWDLITVDSANAKVSIKADGSS